MATPTATHRRPKSVMATLSPMMLLLVSLFLCLLICWSSPMILFTSNWIASLKLTALTPSEGPRNVKSLWLVAGDGAALTPSEGLRNVKSQWLLAGDGAEEGSCSFISSILYTMQNVSFA